jgi:allophanate hydrolase
VSFALGTDTAGSGRVPAGFNNIVGLKPTRGLLSTVGVVPACRSLDCVSVFALTAADARVVFDVAQAADPDDAFSRAARAQQRKNSTAFRFGVPRRDQWEFFGDAAATTLFEQSIERLRAIGGTRVEIDFAPFRTAGSLLYEGPWVAERRAGLKDFLANSEHALHPVTRTVLSGADRHSAVEAFEGLYQLHRLEQETRAAWRDMDVLLVPTAGTIFSIEQVLADPLALNAKLGHYTNFVNLLDLCALALPGGMRADGLPCGVTLIAPPLHEAWLCTLGEIWHRCLGGTLGATRFALPATPMAVLPCAADEVPLAVVGAHLSGLPLNRQLTERGARLLRACRTAPHYTLYALPHTQPPKPGLVFTGDVPGHAIDVEVWAVPLAAFGSFVAEVPPPLAIGTVTLDDGALVKGFVCEGYAVRSAEDISHFGGWRKYLMSK